MHDLVDSQLQVGSSASRIGATGSHFRRIRSGGLLSSVEGVTAADPRIEYATGARLRPWSRVWRYLLVVVSGFLAWLLSYGLFATEVAEGAPDSTVVFVMALFDPIVCVIAICLLPLRRRAPMTIALVTAALSALSTSTASGPAQLAAASNATHRRWLPIVLNGVTYILALAAFELLVPIGTFDSPWVGVIGTAVAFLVPAGFGLYIGARRALIASLHERAVEAERERELQVSAAEAGERTRIAREMHDIVSHSLTVMITLSEGAAAQAETGSDLAPDAMRRVAETGRESLAEMRRLLGVLRTPGSSAELAPQPGADDIGSLIAQFRDAGMPLTWRSEGEPIPPGGVSLAAYRIVQESLTNVLRHAPGTQRVDVVSRNADGVISLTIDNETTRDPAPSDGSGRGLVGMRERAALADGTVEAGLRPDGRWRVHAVLTHPGEL